MQASIFSHAHVHTHIISMCCHAYNDIHGWLIQTPVNSIIYTHFNENPIYQYTCRWLCSKMMWIGRVDIILLVSTFHSILQSSRSRPEPSMTADHHSIPHKQGKVTKYQLVLLVLKQRYQFKSVCSYIPGLIFPSHILYFLK